MLLFYKFFMFLRSNTFTKAISPKILQSPINLIQRDVFGRKPEYQEWTHADTGRIHTERPLGGIKPSTLLLWGNTANHHTIMLLTYIL